MTIPNFNLICLKSSNMHTNTFHASNRPIEPYMIPNPSVTDFGGSGCCRILFHSGLLPLSSPSNSYTTGDTTKRNSENEECFKVRS